MEISPQTFREVEFREKRHGYHPDDVDRFLEEMEKGVEVLQTRMTEALARAEKAESGASRTGESDSSVGRAVVLAQRAADLAVEEARQEGAAIVASAREQADALRAEAALEAERHRAESLAGVQAELARLEAQRVEAQAQVDSLTGWAQEHRARLVTSLKEASAALERAALPSAPESAPIGLPAADLTAADPTAAIPADSAAEAGTARDGMTEAGATEAGVTEAGTDVAAATPASRTLTGITLGGPATAIPPPPPSRDSLGSLPPGEARRPPAGGLTPGPLTSRPLTSSHRGPPPPPPPAPDDERTLATTGTGAPDLRMGPAGAASSPTQRGPVPDGAGTLGPPEHNPLTDPDDAKLDSFFEDKGQDDRRLGRLRRRR